MLYKDPKIKDPHLKIEKAIGRTKTGEYYKFSVEKENDGITSSTKNGSLSTLTNKLFQNNSNVISGTVSGQYNRRGIRSSSSGLHEKSYKPRKQTGRERLAS